MLDWLLSFDEAVRFALGSYESPVLDPLMLGLSLAGQRGMVWIVLAVLFAVVRPGLAAAAWRAGMALLVAFLVNDAVLKPAVGRDRPFTAMMDVRVLGERPGSLSFPSGHAASSFCRSVCADAGLARREVAAMDHWPC
jgi:undecaprenyl-diphosphatase